MNHTITLQQLEAFLWEPMTPPIEFFYDFHSPYSYLALSQLREMHVGLVLRPVKVLELMEKVDNVPTTLTCAAKGRYANVDLARWGQRYGITFDPSDMRASATRRLVISRRGPALSRAMVSEMDNLR